MPRNRSPYVLTVEANPVGEAQLVDEHGEVGLVEGVCDANQLCLLLTARAQCSVPAHVGVHQAVGAVLVLRDLQGAGQVGVGGGLLWV